jgi:mono/diheme cytochrome c family protein
MKKNNTLLLFTIIWFLAFNSGCGPDGTNQQSRQEKIKFKQYLIEGKRLYLLHCSNCHQEDGTGLARLYPPLKDSDYMKKNEKEVICSIKYGQSGEIQVNGIIYNQLMPGNPRLTNLEIAEIMTYIYSTWGEEEKMFNYLEIGQVLDSCERKTYIY